MALSFVKTDNMPCRARRTRVTLFDFGLCLV
jgi:hypothetical protein